MIQILKGTLVLLFNHSNHGVNCLQELDQRFFLAIFLLKSDIMFFGRIFGNILYEIIG